MQHPQQPDRPQLSDLAAEPPRIGKYEILERIGEGGFGVVYKGFDPLIQRFVAIKTCTSPDAELKQRYTREARIAGQLDHPNIVRIFDFGIEGETPFLVQEFLSGEDLDNKINQRAYVPQPERLLYLIHIARGLQYAHSKGVVHRDIKPANLRILDDGTAKIMDFGVAMLQHSDTRLTAAGTTMGTAAYLAPEQIRGEEVDGRTDMFSFGVVAYELITGERPFGQETISAILYEIMNDDPRPITLPTSVCPAGLRQLILRCLEKRPERRYSDCGEIVTALESVRESLRTDPRPRDLTTALRKSPSGTPRAVPQDGRGPESAAAHQPASEGEDFDPVIQHEWTPAGIAIPKRRVALKRALVSAITILVALGAYVWIGTSGIAPWPASWAGRDSANSNANSGMFAGDSPVQAESRGAGSALQPRPTDQPTVEGPPVTAPDGHLATEDESTNTGEEPSAAIDQAESEPSEAAREQSEESETPGPVVEEATLTVPASWHPETTVTIDNGRTLKLSRSRSLELRPGGHQAVFSLSTSDYSARQVLRFELESGEQSTLRSPIQRPGQLTVQASLGSPQGLVAVDGDLMGSSPLRGHKLAPGSHRLDLYPLEGAEAPLATTQLDISAGEEAVVTFDMTGRQELSVHSRSTTR